jgi:hypothetical protein
MLADAATAIEGKFYIHGGGLTKVTPPRLPWLQPLAICIDLEVQELDRDSQHRIEITVFGPDHEVLTGPDLHPFTAPRPVDLAEGEKPAFHVAMTHNGLTLKEVGPHVIRVVLDDREQIDLPFAVTHQRS